MRVQPYIVGVGGTKRNRFGARLRHLGVRGHRIYKHALPCDHWRKRIKTPCAFIIRVYGPTPYLPFPANWPVVFRRRIKIVATGSRSTPW